MQLRKTARRSAVSLAAIVMLMTMSTPITAHAEDKPAPHFEISTVWSSGEDGAGGHRIPGITVTPAGTVIAAAEARSQLGDTDPNDIVIKRSTDGGKTWSKTIMVVQSDGDGWKNPTLLADRDTSRLFMFYGRNVHSYYKFSDDDGLTWSAPVDLSGLFTDDTEGWKVNVPGPGHAVQLSTGRLVVQHLHRKEVTLPIAERNYGFSVIYSDDHGKTWVRGGYPTVDPTYPINEARLLERTDGSLLAVGRNGAGKPRASRVSSVSLDGGKSFAPLHLWTGVPAAVGIDSSLVRFTGGPGSSDASRVLFTWPAAESRAELSVGLSYDDGVTFPERRLIQSGPSGYSDVAVTNDGTVLVLYEVVPELKIARFNLEWLTEGRDSLVDGPPVVFTKLEAEKLAFNASGDATAKVLDDGNTSGGKYVELENVKTRDHLEFSFEIPEEGYYDFGYRLLKSRGRAKVQVYLDGIPAGAPVEGGTSAVSYPFVQFPKRQLSAGKHTLRFVVLDESPTAATRVGIDYIGWFAAAPKPDPGSPSPTVTPTVPATPDPTPTTPVPSNRPLPITGAAADNGLVALTLLTTIGVAVVTIRRIRAS